MKKKYLIITIDTEGDNLWDYKEGNEVQTKNALYIPRFQELCEKYGFKPVYLTNYEMVSSHDFVQYIRPKAEAGLCEVGIHIHAWNNPPYYKLDGPYNGNPYLMEYPYEVMREKFKVTYDLICERIGVPPVSHRAGRWAMNADYFHLLKEFNIKVDCSYTPGISWTGSCGRTIPGGSDYSKVTPFAQTTAEVLEVPVTIKRLHYTRSGGLKHKLKVLVKGEATWLRPMNRPVEELYQLCKAAMNDNCDYLEFMIHSSEFMPGGSPTFKTNSDVENLFTDMDKLFKHLANKGMTGITLKDYYYAKQ